jgi:hypothetical protein
MVKLKVEVVHCVQRKTSAQLVVKGNSKEFAIAKEKEKIERLR